jgi:hypothetical protein
MLLHQSTECSIASVPNDGRRSWWGALSWLSWTNASAAMIGCLFIKLLFNEEVRHDELC